MATKRMFDKAIIDTDRFMDLGLPSKALYFLLGMEADDEGFVSYKKVMRIHGGNEDDINVLVAKGFVIRFPSGVIVITDWNKNNWLDARRIKPTEYQKEKSFLSLNKDKTYCLASAKPMLRERRGEESSIEEKSIESADKSADTSFDDNSLREYLNLMLSSNRLDNQLIANFLLMKGEVGVNTGTIQFQDKKQIQAYIKRNCKSANSLLDYHNKDIGLILERMEIFRDYAKFDWGLETMLKKSQLSNQALEEFLKGFK